MIPWFVDVVAEWAPDGRRIAVTGVPPNEERYRLVIVALPRGVQMRFPEEVATVRPSWSPDGTRLAFATYAALAVADLRTRKVRTIKTMPRDVEVAEVVWAPTGRWIAFTASYVPPSD